MSLFKKVMIIGLATMALGSAAMGDGDKDKTASPGCNGVTDASLFQNKVTAPTQNAKDAQPLNSAPAIDTAPAPLTNT